MAPSRRYEGFLPGRHPIDGFGAGGFRFADMSHVGSLLALPSGIHAIDTPKPFRHEAALYERVFAEAAEIDLLVIGAGLVPLPLPAALKERFRDCGIGVDAMTTASAGSTYNVLIAEGRRVAALLVAID